MIYINLLIIVLIILLALLSRKNKSKYKATYKECNRRIFLTSGQALYELISKKIKFAGIKKSIRKIYVIPERKVSEKTSWFVVSVIRYCLTVVLIVNVISAIWCLYDRITDKDKNNILVRQEYAGETQPYTFTIKDEKCEEEYTLGVAPMEYTNEEFVAKAEEIFNALPDQMKGENSDLKHVSKDLELPEYDESRLFSMSWTSNLPEVLSSNGRLNNLSLSKGIDVILNVKLIYHGFESERNYEIYVEAGKHQVSYFSKVEEELVKAERLRRNEKEIVIPETVLGAKVSLEKEKSNLGINILETGFLICILIIGIMYFGLMEKGKKRDEALKDAYMEFVNQLVLLIGSGMTVKNSLKQIAYNKDLTPCLIGELEYAINMIDTGCDEADTYEQLGKRTGLREYEKLFANISQSIKKGNCNIREVMKECAAEAAQLTQEAIKKKGEQTSTKMLVPMVILLAVVMIIIIMPAIASF